MTWIAIAIGIFILIIVFTSIRTASLNKDPNQKQKLAEIIKNYNLYKEGEIEAIDFQSKTTITLMGSKNKEHLGSMVKTYATMNLPQDQAEELYHAVKGLIGYLAKNT
jgi:hypothetical protein